MTETQSLLAVLVLLYAAECFVLLPRGAWLLRRRIGDGFEPVTGGWGGRASSIHWISPIPLVQPSHIVDEKPKALSESATEVTPIAVASLDDAACRRRLDEWRSVHGVVDGAGFAIFCWVFILSPLLVYHFGFAPMFWILAVVTLLLELVVVTFFAMGHSFLYPDAKAVRRVECVKMILCPPIAMRAGDALALPLFAGFHPFAVAAAFDSLKTCRPMLRRVIQDLRFPQHASGDSAGRVAQLQQLASWLKERGEDVEALVRPEFAPNHGFRGYCPRCLTGYTRADGTCSDCPGVELVPVASDP